MQITNPEQILQDKLNNSSEVLKSSVIKEYKDVLMRNISLLFETVPKKDIESAIDWSINKRFKDTPITVFNNYENTRTKSSILDICNYIIDRQPIITSQGVLFKKHGEVPNPTFKMVDGFILDRKKMKKEMFKYPKGSEMFEKYNLLQLLLKIDSNGLN